jgi:hypothetical protein
VHPAVHVQALPQLARMLPEALLKLKIVNSNHATIAVSNYGARLFPHGSPHV